VKRSTVSKIVQGYIASGMLTEQRHPTDGRRYLISLSPPNDPTVKEWAAQLRELLREMNHKHLP
jgi:DNA-binding MarR family transcriptional regulator